MTGPAAPAGPPDAFPNPRAAIARNPESLCTVVIDAEEEFDWQDPMPGTAHSMAGMRAIGQVSDVFAAHGAVPTYLVTYPVLEDQEALYLLRREHDRGRCALGVQLHPWVTPPFEGGAARHHSFAGNLPPGIEERKLATLCARFAGCFGFAPRIYRAGRYGLGPETPRLLERLGFAIDTSIAPRTSLVDEGGPDFSAMDCSPFWFGEDADILEVPLCRSIVGWGGCIAARLHDAALPGPLRQPLRGLLAATRAAERITLSPEGNDVAAASRLVRALRARGEAVLSLSFHTSSLTPGHNPYVRTAAELTAFLDRLAAMLDVVAGEGLRFVSLDEVPGLLRPPPDREPRSPLAARPASLLSPA